MGPLEITTGIISVANGTFTLTTNFWKLKNVDDDLKVCLQLLLIISRDINAARRLRKRKFPQYYLRPKVTDSLLDRANYAIDDLDLATKELSRSIEAVRVEKSVNNSISIATRFGWVYSKKDNFISQQWVVNAAHARVLSIITSMESLPDTTADTLEPPPAYEEVILRSPSQARALKGKSVAIMVDEQDSNVGTLCELSICREGLN